MNSITAEELKSWQLHEKEFVLIDVREGWEREEFNIGGEHMPVGEILGRRDEIPQELPVVFYCQKGIRSSIVVQRLEGYGFQNLYNLTGGVKAWKASKP